MCTCFHIRHEYTKIQLQYPRRYKLYYALWFRFEESVKLNEKSNRRLILNGLRLTIICSVKLLISVYLKAKLKFMRGHFNSEIEMEFVNAFGLWKPNRF